MNKGVPAADWIDAYVDSCNRSAAVLMGVRRRSDRVKACRKVLISRAAAFASCAPASIDMPSRDRALVLSEIAGAAWAIREVLAQDDVVSERTADAGFREWAANRSALWGGKMAPGLMAASDGRGEVLLPNFMAARLDAPDGPVTADKLTQPAFDLEHAAAFLAELAWAARPRSEAAHGARAAWLDRHLAATAGSEHSNVGAHAFAVHELTGVYGPGHGGTFTTMLRFIATHPPHDRATLHASKVATLLGDALGPRARMALLDSILLSLGPGHRDSDVRFAWVRDRAIVLLLLDADDGAGAGPVEAAGAPARGGVDPIAEIAAETEDAAGAAADDRQARFARAIDADAMSDAIEVIRDAAAAEDIDQASALLRDLAIRSPDVPINVVAPALESDEDGDECFTALTPTPAAAAAAISRVAARLMDVDEHGTEHSDCQAVDDVYTPNYVFDVTWCDRGAQVVVDTKGAMAPAMRHAMVAILTEALRQDGVSALLTGWVPELNGAFVPWGGHQTLPNTRERPGAES